MKSLKIAAAAVTISSSAAFAGGLDRSGQGNGFMFEKGTYSELGFAQITPSIKATPNAYGSIAGSYSIAGGAVKFDLNDKLSFGISVDQPYGADVFYNLLDTGAHLESQSMRVLARYKLANGLSLHGGIANTTVSGWFNPAAGLPAGTRINIASASDLGAVLGGAWERPDIAARVAVTYFSATKHVDASSNSSFSAPQAVNLDFQTGIAADTLLFGAVRWTDLSNSVVKVAGTSIVTYPQDQVSYQLGLGRKFSEAWSGAITVGYEAAQGGIAPALAPTDGSKSIGIGATYTKDKLKITFGYSRVMLGDATTSGLPLGNTWTDNTASGLGVKVAFTF